MLRCFNKDVASPEAWYPMMEKKSSMEGRERETEKLATLVSSERREREEREQQM